MREIVLDTETTGLDPASGDRIVEIGAIELKNHMPTDRVYHQYINPQRAMPAGAFAVHGLSDQFLVDKPVFKDIAADFVAFVDGASLIIHNASFDMKFINAELEWAALPKIPYTRAIDTLDMARRKFPGAQNSLDALCRRFGVDNTARVKHGALLDSEILAEIYLELIGGRQPDFGLNAPRIAPDYSVPNKVAPTGPLRRPSPLGPRLTSQEKSAHAAFVETLGEDAFWKKFS